MNNYSPYYCYLVVFHLEGLNTNSPIIHEQILKENMHLLEPFMVDILPAFEFIMHLPRHIYDYYDLDEKFLNTQYDTPHIILPVPDTILDEITKLDNIHPNIIILSNSCSEEIYLYCKTIQPQIEPIRINQLDTKKLNYCWKMLKPTTDENFEWLKNIDNQFLLKDQQLVALPGLFSSRQLNDTEQYLNKIFNSVNLESDVLIKQWMYKCRINAYLHMSEHYSKSEYDSSLKFQNLYNKSLQEVKKHFDLSAIITMPGVPKEQIKYGLSTAQITKDELRTIRILGVHRAISRNGFLIELERVPIELFSLLSNLEQKCIDGTNNKHVWHLLKKIGRKLGNLFTKNQIEYIKCVKDITVFSDFPIGLAILDGDELPLQCYKAISYRPLSPLTRQLQLELRKTSQYYLGKGKKIKILFVECIINNHENLKVFKYSETVYDAIKTIFTNENFEIVYCRAYDIKTLKEFIENNMWADILYISAHGHYDKHSNMAGIMVGEEFWMADQDMIVPPFVILSACHTSPRGIGAVTIADMFIRNGAIAVLSTFIPVNVKKNMIIMTRLFTYISEAQNGSNQYKTLSELWNGLVVTNAIHEILEESPKLKLWMHEKNANGVPRTIDFQLNRSVGRLNNTNAYSETITIIKEMLKEEGLDGKYSNILDNYNYFPESFFYQFIGNPENIFLYNNIFKEAIEQGLDSFDLR
ncbi:MAG: hypothetical protein ACI4TG_03045 [Ruminococcus sp.]